MIRPRSLRRIKRKIPSGKMTIRYKKKANKPSIKTSPKIRKELLKAKVRK